MVALGRLLEWPEIARSPQLGRFLHYIVERSLGGEEQSIKAYSIAVDVFGRGADFDPQADPIVRVQARRLRRLLEEYYSGPGANEPLQIRLPVGRYYPEFIEAELQTPEPLPKAPVAAPVLARRGLPLGRRIVLPLVAAALVVALGLAAWVRQQGGGAAAADGLPYPSVHLVEFQDLTSGVQLAPQVAGLAIELATDLEQFRNVVVHFRTAAEVLPASDELPVNDFTLSGVARSDGPVIQYSAVLTQNRTRAVVWSHTLAVPAEEAAMVGALDRVSRAFSLILGSSRGPLHAAARQLVLAGETDDVAVNLYLCRVLFHRYRETSGRAEAEKAGSCFARLPDAEQQQALALAATASLLTESDGVALGMTVTPEEAEQLAQANLERAIALDPVSGFVWEQQARFHAGQGNVALARADFASSVQLNPAAADALAAYARLLAFSGGLGEAEQMARDAVEGAPVPPPWYFGVPALVHLRDGDLPAAIEAATIYAEADRELGTVLAIVAGHRAGDSAVVNRYLPQMLEVPSFRAQGVLPQLRKRISDDQLINEFRMGLTQAGVPWTVLTHAF